MKLNVNFYFVSMKTLAILFGQKNIKGACSLDEKSQKNCIFMVFRGILQHTSYLNKKDTKEMSLFFTIFGAKKRKKANSRIMRR